MVQAKPISKTERRFLKFIEDKIISRKQLSICAKCSLKNVDKYLTKLRKKGIIDKNNNLVAHRGGTLLPKGGRGGNKASRIPKNATIPEPSPRQPTAEGCANPGTPLLYRVHSQQFRIRILYKSINHRSHIGTIFIDNNEVRVWDKVIEIYANKSLEFIAEDIHKATELSLDYWSRIIGIIQNDTKTLLIKNRSQNIQIVKEHYAQVGNELAQDVEIRGDQLHIYASDDGKLWLLVDASKQIPELETTRADTGKPDMEKVVKHFQDMRDNDPPTLSELLEASRDTAINLKDTSAGILLLTNLLSKKQDDSGTKHTSGKHKKPDDYAGYQ